MLKNLLRRMAVGFSATAAVAIVIQILMGQSGRSVVTPEFAARFAGEVPAALAQLGLVSLIGAAFAAAAIVFDFAHWSYLRQGAAHFAITAAVWLPVARLCWRPAAAWVLGAQAAGWAFTYAVIWLIQYLVCRRRVAEANARIEARRRDEDVCD